MQKINGGKIYSGSAPLAQNYTNRILSQKIAQEVWKYAKKYALQTYKVEERTFGTPCSVLAIIIIINFL